MTYPILPAYQAIGVAVHATITAFDTSTGAFSFTVAGVSYPANWNTDVLANAITTIGRAVGSVGRLNLKAAKAATLRITGVQSVGSSYGGTDYSSYTSFNATVRLANGNAVTLTINGNPYAVDWGNPAHVWKDTPETTITPNVGSIGTVRLGDALGRSDGLISGGGDKWPATLRRNGMADLRVLRAGPDGEVCVLGADDVPVHDSRGTVAIWRLSADDAGLEGFDPTDAGPQTVRIDHVLKARLGLP